METFALRPYQQRAIDQLMTWFEQNPSGNPCLCMPGGSGKSVVIASIVKDALQNWPETRVLMLVHNKKLIQQNAEKLRAMWPGAPLGIYSAGLKKRQIGEPITYAGIMSVGKIANRLGHQDLIIVDEAHCISNEESGTYRKLIADLTAINPNLRIIGLSASPYRVGQGMLTDGDSAIFSDILYPVTIEELLYLGALCPLSSKATHHKLDKSGLHTRQGDYIPSEMNERFNTDANNVAVAMEAIARAGDRKHWMVFCSGVQHSIDFAECLTSMGVPAHAITTQDSSDDEDRKLHEFETGVVRALCNFGKYTTGYDFPALDCILFLRATKSPGLYLQCAVRGMRPNPDKENCLVLDFAGVVAENGPITAVKPPKKAGSGNGESPVKLCDECGELVHPTAKTCPACGHEFPPPKEKHYTLHNDDIMGVSGTEMDVSAWTWRVKTSRTTGIEMLMVSYYAGLTDMPIKEYICINHEGYAGQKAMRLLAEISRHAGVDSTQLHLPTTGAIADMMTAAKPPRQIEYKKDGKFHNVIKRTWDDTNTNA